MGAAVGQVPEYIQMVTAWCKQYSKLPVIVKLTPNITDIRMPARAAKAGGADAVIADQHHQLHHGCGPVHADHVAHLPAARAAHGGYCGPAVKPIALNMVAEIARDPQTAGLPISGIGGIGNWRDALDFIALGSGTVQVCTAAMVYGFKIVQEMADGLSNYMDEMGFTSVDQIVGKAVPSVTNWQYLNLNHISKAVINQDSCIQCGRCHIACEDTSHQAITYHERRQAPLRGERRRMRGLQPVRDRVPGAGMYYAARRDAGRDRPAHRQSGERPIRQLDHPPEQPDAGSKALPGVVSLQSV